MGGGMNECSYRKRFDDVRIEEKREWTLEIEDHRNY